MKLCGARHPKRDVYCTRADGHDDCHIATHGPWSESNARQIEIARWLNQSSSSTGLTATGAGEEKEI